jgi:hypothetical protein
MEMRTFGRTGMQLSVLGFGCGAVGGLMVRGDPRPGARNRACDRSWRELFRHSGAVRNGESEKNLGGILQRLKPANVVVRTKVRLPSDVSGASLSHALIQHSVPRAATSRHRPLSLGGHLRGQDYLRIAAPHCRHATAPPVGIRSRSLARARRTSRRLSSFGNAAESVSAIGAMRRQASYRRPLAPACVAHIMTAPPATSTIMPAIHATSSEAR